ncbi:DUF1996 domain-containing protein [Actinomycetospora succinea]|uniref:DUF1996 domain-containing protein n=1 Tax=Actinomycetospora succinea TaxID=663603 RepID=UPI001FB818C4|nr:DUF1996 domain-containing protein [Actinomycetospora succinea]
MAALLVTAGVVVAAGSAAAEDGGGDGGILSSLTGSSSSEGSGDESDSESGDDNGSDQNSGDDSGDEGDQNGDGQGGDGQAQGDENDDQGQDGDQGQQRRGQGNNGMTQDDGEVDADNEGADVEAAEAADPFPGRDEARNADRGDYVDINQVEANGNIGEGGSFSGGSYSVDCGVSDHNNSDNYMAAPGKKNGAQHVHDYVGNESTDANSDDDSLEQAGTSCGNGDQSTFFWPVLRNINGQSPDEGEDGGSLDGNVGSILKPTSAQLTFRGHGDEPVEPMPTHLMMIMGNAKQGAQNGENANAKYTCSNAQDRVTEQYPICSGGGKLMRLLDYPSCWDGQNLESANFRDHMAFADDDGNCSDGFKPIPALRITLTYDQPAGRTFQIDSFPNETHDPKTDHSDFENLASQDSNDAGAACINENRTCANLPQ